MTQAKLPLMVRELGDGCIPGYPVSTPFMDRCPDIVKLMGKCG
jgi:hypothetical protein